MNQKNILLIDDDPTLRMAIETFLKSLDYRVLSFENVETAIKNVNENCDLILSDVMMPGLSGYDLLKFVHKKFPNTPILLMTAYGSIEKAVDAMKGGAYDFLIKPFNLSVLESTIKAALLDRQSLVESSQLNDGQGKASTRWSRQKVSEKFITKHQGMLEIIENLRRIAPSRATVLVQGESGTGKELIAQMVHEFSPRAPRIFVAINCAAMPDTLLESELFGHEKGAFTGAVSRQIGKFELAHNGTILLDEISEMSLTMQTKLLRVLQECEIYRVGGVKPIPLNIRVIATTNRDLFKYMREGHFREDLFYRLNVIPITLPPLRERGEDVLAMAKEFLEEFAVLHGRPSPELTEDGAKKITHHAWSGNVRELRNAMERAILVGDFDVIDEKSSDLSPESKDLLEESLIDSGLTLHDIEKHVIIRTLDKFNGNRTKTAEQLGVSLRTLRNKLRSYGDEVQPAPKSHAIFS